MPEGKRLKADTTFNAYGAGAEKTASSSGADHCDARISDDRISENWTRSSMGMTPVGVITDIVMRLTGARSSADGCDH